MTVDRFARLRSGPHVATVTRLGPGPELEPNDAPYAYLVETRGPLGPIFTPCCTWRAALNVAARAIAHNLLTWS